jgi:S-DNA-T family DNA segregation ATPase FtsK/SpoIIIE
MLPQPQSPASDDVTMQKSLEAQAHLLATKLGTFGVTGRVVRSQPGPVVNVHEFEPAAGIKVTKVLSLQDDLALGLKAQSVLMAPQPGKSTIGIEVPASVRETVALREVMECSHLRSLATPLPMALGKNVDGSPLVADLSAMPHLLIAGATGSGKSVGINVTLLSLMMSRTPEQVRFILVDPKMLELCNYDGIGHLLMPVVTDPSKAAGALKWAIDEMERRYQLMRKAAVRNIAAFNGEVLAGRLTAEQLDGETPQALPFIVVVIDELCDLMMTAPRDIEDSIQRLAQKARAAGIHLVLATQRPSVDVITGVIKANLPCRISFQVASRHDSRTIIESVGAERLLGRGDMLFLPPGTNKIVRGHGAYIGDREINALSERLKQLYPAQYDAAMMDAVQRNAQSISQKNDSGKSDDLASDGNQLDENDLYDRAVDFAVSSGTVSTSSLQRNFRIGYNRAARLMDRMVKDGLVGPSDVAGKPRQVLSERGLQI